MKGFFKELGVTATAIITAAVILIGSAICGIIWTRTIGVAQKDAEREAYKATAVYNEGMVDDLAKYYYEFNQADDVERSAIAKLIASRFSNFDESRIENKELRLFLEDCRKGIF